MKFEKTMRTRLISIQINGEASDFADVIDEAFRMAREAAASKTAINKSIVRKGVRADVKVDP